MTSRPAAPTSPFGASLRRWRQHRGLSQLTLACRVASTSRHLSFLETGRSRPSRDMVLRLADTLELGLRDTNTLLNEAGLPSLYRQDDLDVPDLAPYRAALNQMLNAHEPYPGLVLDRHWNVVLANQAALRLFSTDLIGRNFVRDSLTNPAAATAIANWPETAWAGLNRLHHQLDRTPFDHELRALVELVELADQALSDVPRPPDLESALMICPSFRHDGEIIHTIAIVALFDSAGSVALDELRIELLYPLDDTAARHFARAQPTSGGQPPR